MVNDRPYRSASGREASAGRYLLQSQGDRLRPGPSADTAHRISSSGNGSGAITQHLGRAPETVIEVLERLYEKAFVSVTEVRHVIGTTFAGTNQIAPRLVDLKILKELTGQARHRQSWYYAYVRLFDEEAGS